MELLEVWRWINVVCALIAALLLWWNKARHDFYHFPRDIQFSTLALLIWPVCYAFATTVAQLSGNKAGIWTIIMSIPIVWMWFGALLPRFSQNGSKLAKLARLTDFRSKSRRDQSL